LWGTENHVRHIFAGTGVTLEFARESIAELLHIGERTVESHLARAYLKFGEQLTDAIALRASQPAKDLRSAAVSRLGQRSSAGTASGSPLGTL
jgi:hypothetical protein